MAGCWRGNEPDHEIDREHNRGRGREDMGGRIVSRGVMSVGVMSVASMDLDVKRGMARGGLEMRLRERAGSRLP